MPAVNKTFSSLVRRMSKLVFLCPGNRGILLSCVSTLLQVKVSFDLNDIQIKYLDEDCDEVLY